MPAAGFARDRALGDQRAPEPIEGSRHRVSRYRHASIAPEITIRPLPEGTTTIDAEDPERASTVAVTGGRSVRRTSVACSGPTASGFAVRCSVHVAGKHPRPRSRRLLVSGSRISVPPRAPNELLEQRHIARRQRIRAANHHHGREIERGGIQASVGGAGRQCRRQAGAITDRKSRIVFDARAARTCCSTTDAHRTPALVIAPPRRSHRHRCDCRSSFARLRAAPLRRARFARRHRSATTARRSSPPMRSPTRE